MTLALLVLLAPVLYGLIGLGCLRLWGEVRERFALAPLLGFCLAGLVPLVGVALGGVPFLTGGVLLLLGFIGLATLVTVDDLRRPECLRSVGLYLLCYAIGVLVFLVTPLPAFGLWGTDWRMYLRAGEALLEFASDPAALGSLEQLIETRPRLFASRPQLFSTAVAPLAAWAPPLVARELAAASVSASVVPALVYGARRLGRPEPSVLWVLFFVSTPLYTLQLTALWPKFAMSGCVIVSLVDAVAHRRSGRMADLVWSWLWIGFGCAAHHSAALYLPLLVALQTWSPSARLRIDGRALLRSSAVGAVAMLVTAGVYELWSIAQFGLGARVAANPSVHLAGSTDAVSVAGRTLQQLGMTFVGGSVSFIGRNVVQALSAPSTDSALAALGYWSQAVSGWLVFQAGTFLGMLLPLLLVARSELAAALRSLRESELLVPIVAGSSIALVAAAALAPIVSLSAAQLGATPICIALLWLASPCASSRLRGVLGVSLLLGAFPFAAQLIAARMAFGWAMSGDAEWLDWFLATEGDTKLFLAAGATPLSAESTLAVWLVIAASIALAGWLLWRARGATDR